VNGATYVNVDLALHPRNGSPMLVIEDDGGGMTPDRMRQCMSLGYSAKSKSANTIGQCLYLFPPLICLLLVIVCQQIVLHKL